MSKTSKREYIDAIRERYRMATKHGKQRILDEVCQICDYNRKYAIRLLNELPPSKCSHSGRPPGRFPQYDHPDVFRFLKRLWKASNLACGKRLKAMIALWLPFDQSIAAEARERLETISAATIDRLLAPVRRLHTKRGLATTKPGSLLKKHIPIKTNQWDEHIPRTPREEDSDEDTTIKELKSAFAGSFRSYHKYIAIVHADGDSIGEIVKLIGGNPNDIPHFSGALLDFAMEATKIVVLYGGAPVYMGGDDMLFFAPVANKKPTDLHLSTIFDLMEQLNSAFQTHINARFDQRITDEHAKRKLDDPVKLPTLSFGVSITFHKFPLYEAKRLSYDKLMYVKNHVQGKNAIRIDLLKHSGQHVPFTIRKSQVDVFKELQALVKTQISKPEFLNSLTHKLETQKLFLIDAAYGERLEYFFENNFNEEWNVNKALFEEMCRFISVLAKQTSRDMFEIESLELIYGILRFIHFVRSNDKS